MIPPESSDRESDGFDFPNGNTNTRHLRLRHFECGGKYPSYPFRSLVKLYARLGLHRYNLLEGKNLQLDSLESFNMSITGGPSSYYLSLVARVPDSGLQQPFQVFVQERSFGFLDLGCPIARPLVTTKEPFLRPHSDPPPPDGMFFSKKLPR
ncbi:PREDICTED: UPF0725 protein EMB2204-like, partial [Camelina sativa]|uniref:UPF0725 protein EMB2204-like n=1 Tax=Camelina sativa TaxID=90675 RepID=A0ABM0X4N5_CAMSA